MIIMFSGLHYKVGFYKRPIKMNVDEYELNAFNIKSDMKIPSSLECILGQ